MEEIRKLIETYKLEEDPEHIIIPIIDKNGTKKRCFLLKRRFIRIVYSEEHFVDCPLEDAIIATIKYPDLLLSEALYLLYKESFMKISDVDSTSNNQ